MAKQPSSQKKEPQSGSADTTSNWEVVFSHSADKWFKRHPEGPKSREAFATDMQDNPYPEPGQQRDIKVHVKGTDFYRWKRGRVRVTYDILPSENTVAAQQAGLRNEGTYKKR